MPLWKRLDNAAFGIIYGAITVLSILLAQGSQPVSPLKTALVASQVLCVALLALLGARAGWVLDHRVFPAILGALFVGSIGGLLSVMKYVIH